VAEGRYSGAFIRTQYYDVPRAVHLADEEHMTRGQVDGQTIEWTSPPTSLPPGFDQYIDDTAGPDDVADHQISTREGFTLDQTPSHDHLNVGDHNSDLGSARAQHWAEKSIRGPSETYGYQSVPSFAPEKMQPTDENLRRGINSHPMNNPPLEMYGGRGFREGTWEFAERGRLRTKLSRVIRTDHGVHPLRPNTVYVPPRHHYLRDVPLWQSFARMIEKVEKRNMVRRVPPEIGEVIAEDGGPGTGDETSIIGGF